MNIFTTLDWSVLGAYFVGTLAVGLYFWRKSRSTEGFTAAERSLPGWLVGLSIFATYLSSISYLALPGKSFVGNWNPFVFSLTIPIATWISVQWFLPYYRASRDVSAYSHLENRFGSWARLYASIFYLLTQLARIGIVTYLLALPMSVLFGWDIRLVIVVTGVTVTIYTFIGGIIAVIWTDAIQTVVLLAGAFVTLFVLAMKMDGGLIVAVATAWEQGKFSLGDPGLSVNSHGDVSFQFGSATIVVVLLYGFCENLKNFGIDQSYVQRYQTAKSEKEARKSLWYGAALYLPVSAMFYLIGTCLFVFYHSPKRMENDLHEIYQITAHQQLMQEGIAPFFEADTGGFSNDYRDRIEERVNRLSEKDIGDRVFPHFIGKYLPPGLTGLLIAAIFSAGMSTISGSLNSSATLLLKDYYLRFFRPNAAEKESMRVLYFSTILFGVLGTGMALILVRLTDSALDIWWTLAGIFGGGMLGLFLLGLISRRAKNGAAVVAVFLGTTVIFYLTMPEMISWLERHRFSDTAMNLRLFMERYLGGVSPFHSNMIPVFGTLAILAAGIMISYFGKKRP